MGKEKSVGSGLNLTPTNNNLKYQKFNFAPSETTKYKNMFPQMKMKIS